MFWEKVWGRQLRGVKCIAQTATFCRSLLTGLFSCHKIELGIDYYQHRLRFFNWRTETFYSSIPNAALNLFCATNNVGFRSFEHSGFLPTKDYCGPPWNLYSEVEHGGYVVNVRNSGRSTDEKENRQDSAPLFISNAYYTMRARPRRRNERGRECLLCLIKSTETIY